MRLSDEIRGLFQFVRPYRVRLFLGVILLAVMGVCEGIVALMIIPAWDSVLNPHNTAAKVKLVTLPAWVQHSLRLSDADVYLNSFLPSNIHYVWTIFAICLVVVFISKSIAEFFGSTMTSPGPITTLGNLLKMVGTVGISIFDSMA